IEIGPMIDLSFATCLFWRHVGWCSRDLRSRLFRCDSEINDHWLDFELWQECVSWRSATQEDVARLEITMKNAKLSQLFQSSRNEDANPDDFARTERSAFVVAIEFATIDPLHHQVGST